MKNGELATYCHHFIIGQLLVAANQPENIDVYVCKKNEVKLMTCLYEMSTGKFQGIKLSLAYIILRGDIEELFFSYGVNPDKSAVLYAAAKERIPNAIVSICFKKHIHEIMNERRHNEQTSSLFFYLPSITNRKEKINQFRDNVNLNPIDDSFGFLNSFSPDKADFQPHLLNSSDPGKRDPQVELLYNFFTQMAEASNANLIRNANFLRATEKRKNNEIVWVGPTKQRYDNMKFKLTY